MVDRACKKFPSTKMKAEGIAEELLKNPDLLLDVKNGISSHETRTRFGCAKALSIVGRKKPEILYPQFDHFVESLDSTNNIIKWNMIDILANLTAVDSKKKFEAIFDKYYGLLQDKVMITAAHVVDNSPTIAKTKPNLTSKITAALLDVEQAQEDSPECHNILIGKAIVAFDGYFDQIRDKDEIVAFVKRQIHNSRNATRVKAQRFLEKRARP